MARSERQLQHVAGVVQIGCDGGQERVAANNASASVRVPHQATTITTVTARNSALNSIVVLQSRRSIVDEGAWFATSSS